MARAPLRILIINPFGIGDVLFSTPLIAAVRAAYPEAFLAYLCNRRTEEILRHNPHVNVVLVFEKDDYRTLWRVSRWRWLLAVRRLLRQVACERFDVAIDLSLSDRYSGVLLLLGVPQRVGFNYRGRGRFLTHRVDISGYQDKHVVEYYRDLLRSLQIGMNDGHLQLFTTSPEREQAAQRLGQGGIRADDLVVGIVPGGGTSWGVDSAFRRWGIERFAHVGDVLAERYGAKVVLFGERSDMPICRAVAERMRHQPVDTSGTTSLAQFIHLVHRCQLIVCNDGGPLHIAVSLGVRTVSVFGPVNPRVYGPYPPSAHHRVVTKDLACRPCYQYFRLPPCPYDRACLETLETEPVLAVAQELLEQLRPVALAAGG